MEVCNIKEIILKDPIIVSGEGEGPNIKFEFVLHNYTDTTITIDILSDFFYLEFRYKDSTYFNHLFFSESFSVGKTTLLQGEKIIKNVFSFLFLGTDIYKPMRNDSTDFLLDRTQDYEIDYTEEMLKVLPTIRICYRNKDFDMKTTHIMNVKVEY